MIADNEEMVSQVRTQSDSKVEIARVELLLFKCLSSQEKQVEAADLARCSLRKLGVKFPQKITEVHIVPNVLKIKLKLRKLSD